MFRFEKISSRVRQADGEETTCNFYLPINILVVACLRMALIQAETCSILVKSI
jgi:hypothetical protein